jgi:acetone carboxylase gamma subunit
MIKKLKEKFDKLDEEYLKFDRVKNKLSSRPDIHAFILLNQLHPSHVDIVGGANHDEIFLNVDPELISNHATDEQVADLVRCGVIYGEYGLTMMV